MNRINHLLAVVLALVATAGLQAQEAAATLYLSHCDGVLAPTGVKGCSGKQWNAAATLFPAADVARMVGNQVSAVRVGMASKLNVEEMTFWVRASLDGENLAEASTAEIVKGWVELSFDAPYSITCEQDLYIGMSYRQKGASKCVAVHDDRWVDGGFYFQQGEAEWTDCSSLGIACIEGCITGANLPQYDLSISDVHTPANYLIGSTMSVDFTVSNLAAATISGFTTRITVDDAEPVEQHHGCWLPYRESMSFTATLTPVLDHTEMNAPVRVEIFAVDGGEDINLADNTALTQANLLLREYERHMLIEEFTTENCVNCPGAASLLHQLLDDAAYSCRVSAVCHHVGYGSDWLTTDNASQYLWFYNSSQTYAPAFMWDRTLLPEAKAPVTECPANIKDMRAIVDDRLATTSLCKVEAEAAFNADSRLLQVNVRGERCAQFCDTPARVTVFVVEDNVKALAQSGATTTPYYHQHVLRGYNATFGAVIDWTSDDTFSYECQIEVCPEWQSDELRIIAFVSGYNADDPTDCAIENSCEIAFPGASGIASVHADPDASPTYYTLWGHRVSGTAPHPGLLLISTK